MLSGLLVQVTLVNSNILNIAGQIRKPCISSCAPLTPSGMETKTGSELGL